MAKWLSVFCLTCVAQAWAGDARFIKPAVMSFDKESRLESYAKSLEAKYEKLRTIKRTETSCWLVDYRKKGVWLKFEQSL